MNPFYIDFFEDLDSFVKLCQVVAASESPQPVFYADEKDPVLHFFLATPLYRAHLELHVTAHKDKAIARIRDVGQLEVIRGTLRQWSIESPVFRSLFDSSLL